MSGVTTFPLGTALLAFVLGAAPQANGPNRPFQECEAEVARLVGHPPAMGATTTPKAPRKLRGRPLDLSDAGGRRGSGIWMGEALIGADGRVQKVWTRRSPAWEPAWPEFDDLVAANIRSWVYRPSVVDGSPVPVCLAMTVNIDWRE